MGVSGKNIAIRRVEKQDDEEATGVIWNHDVEFARVLIREAMIKSVTWITVISAGLVTWYIFQSWVPVFIITTVPVFYIIGVMEYLTRQAGKQEDIVKGVFKYWHEGNEKSEMFVAVIGYNIIGTIAIKVVEKRGELVRVAVVPGWRRKGVGEMLVRHALKYCKDCCLTSVVLRASNLQYEARHLYRKVGFEETGYDIAWLPLPFQLNMFYYQLDLQEYSFK